MQNVEAVDSEMGLDSRRALRIVGRVVLLGCWAALSACVTPRNDAPDSSETATGTERARVTTADAPANLVALVRRGAVGYEVEVRAPGGFPPGNLTPVLRIGDREFVSFKESPTVGLGGLVFLLTEAEFQSLPDRSAIMVGFGPGSHPGIEFRGRRFGTLVKSAVDQ